jgi:hypothetical protein
MDVFIEINEPKHFDNSRLERRPIGDTGLLVVDPIRRYIAVEVA